MWITSVCITQAAPPADIRTGLKREKVALGGAIFSTSGVKWLKVVDFLKLIVTFDSIIEL
jgi:hypothetical protein